MKNIKWLVLILLITLAYFGYSYIYQNHRDISKETADFKITSSALLNAFQENPKHAETQYLNNTVIVTGITTEVNSAGITIDNAIFCNLDNTIETSSLKKSTNISIKGRCIGYDDLLEQVKLDQCSIIN